MWTTGSKNEAQGKLGFLFLLPILLFTGCLRHAWKEALETPDLLIIAATRGHYNEGEPCVVLYPIIDGDEVAAVMVRVDSHQKVNKDLIDLSAADTKLFRHTNIYCLGENKRNGICCSWQEVHLIADGNLQRFDKKALANGPWIYYFDHSNPSRRIQVPQSEIQQWESDVYNLPPLEFVNRWCKNQPGELYPLHSSSD